VCSVQYGFLVVLFGVYLGQFIFDTFQIVVVLALTTPPIAVKTILASVFDHYSRRKWTLIFFSLAGAVAGIFL